MIFRTCPNCGVNLDPGEICDCKRESGQEQSETQAKKEKSPPVADPAGID